MANYINGKELHDELCVYYNAKQKSNANNTESPLISEKLGHAFLQIAIRMASRPNFSGYTYKDEMIADGVMQCILKVHTYDPARANVDSPSGFAWCSQLIWNSFIARIKKEQHECSVKARLIRDKMSSEFVQHGVDSSNEDNSFIEFLKDVDAYVDYNEIREDNAKKQLASSLTHRNKTSYKKKEDTLKILDTDLEGFFS